VISKHLIFIFFSSYSLLIYFIFIFFLKINYVCFFFQFISPLKKKKNRIMNFGIFIWKSNLKMLQKSRILGKLFFVVFGWWMIISSCQSSFLNNWGFQRLVTRWISYKTVHFEDFRDPLIIKSMILLWGFVENKH
jgi:hypothetical protein